ncbi:MAG: hypothetical protein EOM80_02055 [Erysipelotrichia bacterium]|nr:hypothetical protein [Candidatus Riflebacteria bacterium]NCB37528.1 hypothetical protein [Erysipelotrichia bacterium]
MNSKKGFTVFFIFLIMLLVLFSGFYTQGIEMFHIGWMQQKYLSKLAVIKPVYVRPAIETLIEVDSDR